MKHRLMIVCAASLICWFSRTAAQSPLFVGGQSVTVPGGTGYVGLFDLNRDGHLDLISGARATGKPEVRPGNGRGRFSATIDGQSDFGVMHAAIAFGDVSNDGILDSVQASRDKASEYIHVFLGSGDGRFATTPHTRLVANRAIDFYKPQIWILDVNEDRKADIVTQNGRRNTLEIFTGDGRGGFGPPEIINLDTGYNLYTSAIGDIDGDGHLDLIVAMSPLSTQEQGKVRTFRGNGTGKFSEMTGGVFAVASNPVLATLADVNGDTRLDIVLSHSERELLSVLLGETNGRLAKPATFPLEPGTSAFTVTVGDANRDKRPDLIVATVNSVARPYNSAVAVLLGNGTTFTPATGSPYRVGPGAYRMAAGDIDEDGKLDIVTSSFEGEAIHVLLGR